MMNELHDKNIFLPPPAKSRSFWKGKLITILVLSFLVILLVTLPIIWYLHRLDANMKKPVYIWQTDHIRQRFHEKDAEFHVSDSSGSDEDKVMDRFLMRDSFSRAKATESSVKKPIRSSSHREPSCSIIEDNFRFDCHPERGASKEKCESRGCCWLPPKQNYTKKTPNSLGVPYCFYPEEYPSYYCVNSTRTSFGVEAYFIRNDSSYYHNDIMLLKYEFILMSGGYRQRVYDPNDARYEIPYRLKPQPKHVSESPYDIIIQEKPFSIQLRHKVTKKFKSIVHFWNAGGFIYTDQFIQFSSTLIASYNFTNFYGLGERSDNFRRSTDWQQFTMFSADQAPVSNSNLYGSHPFLLGVDDSGHSIGLLFYNSNAMDIILQPAPAITYRTTGGIVDWFYFEGFNPAQVIQQYTAVVGRPLMPPYWALGFHLSRWGYNSVEETRRVWENTRKAGIPFDVQWNDIDYMEDHKDFTYDKKNFAGLPQFIDDVHKVGMHYMLMFDPGLDTPKDPNSYPPYAEGLKQGVFINDTDGKPFVGKVWSSNGAVWPDFTNPRTVTFWTEQMRKFHQEIPFDGAWIDMNEPSNFLSGTKTGCPTNSTYENPPYVPGVLGGKLNYHTVCMTARQHANRSGIHYNVHNLYGLSETIATNKALKAIRPGKRPFIISRSSFVGQGHYGSHWTGDVYSSWDDMKKSIPAILDFSLFGVPMIGADICGFNGNTTVKLCQRWMELGAFYPFSRNHNSIQMIAQDPVSLGEDVVISSRNALTVRYMLLPYLYTLFYRAHIHGDTVARPLFFEFPYDVTTYPIDNQFLWGPALMILPVLDENAEVINSYFPEGRWYSILNPVPFDSPGKYYDIPAPPGMINLAFRGGYIIPVKDTANTTTESRKSWFGLLVALNPGKEAKGELYWDDGESLDAIEQGKYNLISFTSKSNTIVSDIIKLGAAEELTNFQNVLIYGVDKAPETMKINGKNTIFAYDEKLKLLMANKFSVSLAIPFTIIWS